MCDVQGLLELCDADDADTDYNEACILYKVSLLAALQYVRVNLSKSLQLHIHVQ